MKALAALALLVVACTSRNPDSIVLWHAYNGAERDALQASAARWNAEHPDHPLELVGVPHQAFADKLTSAIPNGNGPDLFIYAQDRIGGWVDAGVVEPLEFWLDDARMDRFSGQAIRAMDYKGSIWGLPMTILSAWLDLRREGPADSGISKPLPRALRRSPLPWIVRSADRKFMEGVPKKPATNRFAGCS